MAAAAALIQQQQVASYSRPSPAQKPIPRRFTVWNGVTINRTYGGMADLAAAVYDRVPAGVWDEVEWLVKAGEAGTYQAVWDPHPLAISGPDKLAQLRDQGRGLGLVVTPYVVVRGNPEWRSAEVAQIRELASVSGRVVLNLEPGSQYAHWSICAPGGADQYMHDLGVPSSQLELCSIPRAEQINELGGPSTMGVWLSYVATASWETYGVVAPTSLRVDIAVPFLERVFPGILPEQRLPVVQRPEVNTWAATEWADLGLQCWHLDGSI